MLIFGQKKSPAATYSPTENRSTIGVRALNFRVRDGNGCVCPAVATGPANTGEREHVLVRPVLAVRL
jgi:hypothetical protein